AIPAVTTLTATDNCGTATVAFTETTAAGTCAGSYILTRTWIATDLCGLTATHVQTITVQDTTAPTFVETLPTNVTVECSAVPTAPTLTATDNCGTASVAYTETTAAGTCAGSYTLTRTWIATDLCGLSTTHVQTITVQDRTAPVVPSAPQDVTVNCPSDVPPMISLTAIDDCSGNIVASGTDTIILGSCPSSYVIIRTWNFTDNCNNTSSVSQTITVNSSLNILNKYGIITVNNYFGQSSQTNYVTAVGTIAAFNGVTPGTMLPNGGTALHVMGPIMTISGTLNLNNKFFAFNGTPVGGTINAPNGGQLPTNTAVSNDISMIGAISNDLKTLANTSTSYAEFFDGNKVRLNLIPNANGMAVLNLIGQQLNPINEIYFNFGANVKDVVINVNGTDISIPANQNTNRSDLNNKIIWNYFEATNLALTGKVDGSVLAPKAHFSMNHNVEGGVYVNILNQNARVTGFYSGRLNSSAYIIIPPNPVINVTCANEVPAINPLSASDGCGNTISVPGSDVITAGSCPNSFTIVRTWTAVDPCGYTIYASQTINVNDTVAPTFVQTLPTNVTVECSAVPTAVVLTATDNCGTATVAFTETTAAGTCAGSYTLTRTWIATDLCGLTATHVQTITVQDTTAPTFVETLPTN
ncbi:HYR-like domain-containing protein, partial [Flavobacterium macacae]|uniref:HYR-like domain-containing protein n=1 Tax=Flavobacterium macacae TaxID=2488993 RepID=UPI0018F7153A